MAPLCKIIGLCAHTLDKSCRDFDTSIDQKMGENQDNCAGIKMNKIRVIKSVLSLFALCKITSKAIELMVDYCKENCGPWAVLVGENNHFISR